MSGAGFITSTRLRETMSPLEQAWSVLKADPESQAWSREYGTGASALAHPDAPNSLGFTINNEGTIDPNVMSMRNRMFRNLYDHTEAVGRADPKERGFGTTAHDFGDLNVMDDSQGFTALTPEGGISRVDRPHAYTENPPVGSPQQEMDDVRFRIGIKTALGTPLTPEEQEHYRRYYGQGQMQ